MAFEPSVAVFDACILYPFHLRNIIVRAAVDRLVEARWTDETHDEWIRNLAADTPTIPHRAPADHPSADERRAPGRHYQRI
jgi:hypothetical protein